VWSKVIATGLLAAFGAIAVSWFEWWGLGKAALIGGIDFLIARTAVQNWLICLLAVGTLKWTLNLRH
jgi:hypothetical protein